MAVEDDIRAIVAEYAKLDVPMDEVTDTTDLFDAGMTSHSSVNLMLALEERFDFEFPDQLLRRSTFASVSAIKANILSVLGEGTDGT
jgi:acyl carrier protein